jgi:hypothetical protein
LELKSALSSVRICGVVVSSTPCSRNIFSTASFQISHFLFSRPLLYAILFSSNPKIFENVKNPDWIGGERQPTAETALRHIPIKNDKRKTAKAL